MSTSPDDWVTVVEALYHYESTNARGHSVIVQPGEMYYLIRDVDEDWWFVGRSSSDGDGFFFPHSYGKVVQRQQHRMANQDALSMSADSAILGNGNLANRLSTFGDSSSMKRRSYQLATITDNQLAIYDNPMALSAGGGDGDQFTEPAPSSLIRRKSRGPGFKLADPNRISRSIPVDLNFVHIPKDESNGGGRIVSFYGDSKHADAKANLEVYQEEEGCQKPIDQPSDTPKKPADGPIYANVKPMSAKELPPLPVPGSNPINLLHDGWAEYVDKNNRHYFYNANLKKAMWKPPRLAATSGSGSIAPGIAVQGSVSSGDELDASFVSDDGELSAGPRDPSLSASLASTAELESPSADGAVSVPGHSSSTGHPVGIRPLSIKKSLDIVADINGDHRSNHDNGTTSHREVDVYACSEDLANIATKLRSSTDEQSPTGDAPNSTLGRCGSYGQNQSQNYVRFGILNRCKYMEAGKRVKKQWLPCFIYLTNAHLIFYKDEKSAEKKGNQYPTPLGVCDLRGAKLRWLEGDVSRRKNVFQVQLMDDTVYLFHAENQPEITDWYEDLRQVIDQLPIPDCYPTPRIESSTPTRFSMRKPSSSKNAAIAPPPLELPKQPPVTSASKDADKRKSVSFGQPPQSLSLDLNDPALQKETILEKLRKFFRSRPSVESLKERGIYKAEPVFGSSLTEICRREKTTVPKFIVTCTALIEEKGLSTDGLYRINGNLSQVQRIRCQVDQEKYSALLNEMDVHVLTGALKLFFRELQEPAFPTSSTKDFLNAIKLQNSKQRWKAFSELILKLPQPHHDTLDHLFQHLLNVAKHSAKNRMQIHNLAIVFGPSLFSSNPSAKSTDVAKTKSAKKKAEMRGTSVKEAANSSAVDPKNFQRAESSSSAADVTHSNSQLAFTMILQGQIVEYLLKEHAKLFKSSTSGE